ncbi:MAG: anti-sigma factor antagonist [Solirubrobacteraceae bacterium]|jgi:anti-sigma B factor antagonist|nr:anti-sigma factor antagonist [Solirubrobacteraceae bacterium]
MPEQMQRSPVRFAFSHRDLDTGAAVISVEGDCDLASAPTLKWALVDLLAGGRSRIIVDLARVSFMDSTALGALVGVQMNLKDGEMLLLAAAPHGVLSLFELTGLDQRFKLFETVDGAAAHVRETSPDDADGAVNSESSPIEYAPAPEDSGDLGTDPTELTRDAALALGLASTAVPFARSRPAQAERWLRVLVRCGGAGVALTTLGVTDIQLTQIHERETTDEQMSDARADRDAVSTVTEHARRFADGRDDSSAVRTTDLLEAVIEVYGSDLDGLLAGYGTNCDEVSDLLAADLDEVSDS